MDPEIKSKLDEQSKQLSAIYSSVEKTRKYFLWTLIITIVVFVLPLVALIFILPAAINTLTSGLI